MNRPVSLLWFEGNDSQSLPAPLAFAAPHGCDLQPEPVPLPDALLARMPNAQQEEDEELSDEETYLILKRLRELGYLD